MPFKRILRASPSKCYAHNTLRSHSNIYWLAKFCCHCWTFEHLEILALNRFIANDKQVLVITQYAHRCILRTPHITPFEDNRFTLLFTLFLMKHNSFRNVKLVIIFKTKWNEFLNKGSYYLLLCSFSSNFPSFRRRRLSSVRISAQKLSYLIFYSKKSF
jgi:hypothetical protein